MGGGGWGGGGVFSFCAATVFLVCLHKSWRGGKRGEKKGDEICGPLKRGQEERQQAQNDGE